jgi:hypothetical protein
MRRGWKSGVGIFGTVALASSCGDGVAPEPQSLEVAMEACLLPPDGTPVCPVASASPLDRLEVRVTVTPRGGVRVEGLELTFSGLLSHVSFFESSPPARTTAMAYDTVALPLAVGGLTVRAVARGGGVQGDAAPLSVTVGDTVPPVLVSLTLSEASAEPGDSVLVRYTARDNAGVDRVVLTVTGAFSLADSLPAGGPEADGEFRLRIPSTAEFGSVAELAVHAVDGAGLRSEAWSAALEVVDLTPPTVQGHVLNGTYQVPVVPGDTVRMVMSAADNHRLTWIGYRVGDPLLAQDSVAVTGSAAELHLDVVAEREWAGTRPVVHFARDSTGNLATTAYAQEVRVVDAARRPTRSVDLLLGIQSMIHDTRRDRLLLLASERILVLPLGTLQWGAPVELPALVHGNLALTAGGDSLLVPLGPYSLDIGLVDLAAGSPIERIPVTADSTLGWPGSVAATRSDRVLIGPNPGTIFSGLLELDLSTGEQRRRMDAGFGGELAPALLYPVAGGRKVLALWYQGPGWTGQLYGDDADRFGEPVHLGLPEGSTPDGGVSVSAAGDRILVGGILLDDQLQRLAAFDYPSSPGFPASVVSSALARDGGFAYFVVGIEGTSLGLLQTVRIADGVLVESALLPASGGRLLLLDDGRRLVVRASSAVHVIDLH